MEISFVLTRKPVCSKLRLAKTNKQTKKTNAKSENESWVDVSLVIFAITTTGSIKDSQLMLANPKLAFLLTLRVENNFKSSQIPNTVKTIDVLKKELKIFGKTFIHFLAET